MAVLVIALVVPKPGRSQTSVPNSTLAKATVEYQFQRYDKAVKMLFRVSPLDPAYLQAQEMLADCYRKTGNYDRALQTYELLTQQIEVKPHWYLCYAEVLVSRKQYDQARIMYEKYLQLVPADKRAKAGLASLADIQKNSADSLGWKVEYTNLNKKSSSEYSPVYYKNGLLFVSDRKSGCGIFGPSVSANLYYVEGFENIKKIKENDTNTPVAKAKKISKKVNTKMNEGPALIMPGANLLFSRVTRVKTPIVKGTYATSKMYTTRIDQWNNLTPFLFNSEAYSVMQPALSKDGSVLFFSSNMPGGFGAYDLYYCLKDENTGAWAKPVNMGPVINTEGDEMYPFMDEANVLYFASSGHGGFGGLDIFKASLRGPLAMTIPENLGAPLNSSADDFGFVKRKDKNLGYFSSNRSGNTNIYAFEQLTYDIKLKGVLVDKVTRKPLSQVLVSLISDTGIDTLRTDREGRFEARLKNGTDFEVKVTAPKYTSGVTRVSSKGLQSDTVLTFDLQSEKKCDSIKRVFNNHIIYYGLNKADINEDAKSTLDQLAGIMQAYPDILVATASYCDSRASVAYNEKLSKRRGQAAKDYLVTKGIDPKRIEVEYFGKRNLVNYCKDGVKCTETEHQLNRRTEIHIVYEGVDIVKAGCSD